MDYVQHVIMLLNKLLNDLKMLYPRLTNCYIIADISSLLIDIDNRLTQLANKQYNNLVYAVNQYISGEVVGDLLNYKQILTYKLCNQDYCSCYTVEMIASRVKVLIHK